MHEDLRRRALESGKTTSRKAKSKTSSQGSSKANSAANSRAGSRVTSRVVSRDVSDDEETNGNISDDTNHSINSIDALLESDDFNEQTTEAIRQELSDAIENIIERKGSSVQGRESALTQLVRCLTSHYLAEGLYNQVPQLVDALGKSIRAGSSEKETVLALRAISLIAITFEDASIYEHVSGWLRKATSDSQSEAVKAAAIQSTGICSCFGGAGEEEIVDIMTFLLEIVSSDGAFVDANDSPEVVVAALFTYGFLATQVEDLEHESEDAIAAFLDQLDSSDARVQIAAGENIALLYEKSYTPREEDETPSPEEEEDDGSPDEDGRHTPSGLVKRYNAYHNTNDVFSKVSALAGLSTKSMNKRDKRLVHQSFASITMTVENPRIGLVTNSSAKMVVRIHREGEMRVDKWWKLMRLNAIRRLLGGGFVNHYFEGNKQILDALPMILRGAGEAGLMSPRKPKGNKGKFRENRRFISAEFA